MAPVCIFRKRVVCVGDDNVISGKSPFYFRALHYNVLKHKSFTIPIKSHWCCYSSSNVHPVKIRAKTCRQQGALFINQVYLLRGPVYGILRKLSAEMKFNIHNTGMFSLVQSGKSLFSLPLDKPGRGRVCTGPDGAATRSCSPAST